MAASLGIYSYSCSSPLLVDCAPSFPDAVDSGFPELDDRLLQYSPAQDFAGADYDDNMMSYGNDEKRSRVNGRIGFRTRSEVEILDDGFKWRKYGKKAVKNSPNPRNYYRCSTEGCCVKKRVERDRDDPRYVITTYDGVHNHVSPCARAAAYADYYSPSQTASPAYSSSPWAAPAAAAAADAWTVQAANSSDS